MAEADDGYTALKISRNPDGSLTRPTLFPLSPANSSPSDSSTVLSQDFPLNPANGTWIRVFRPDSTACLPVIVYFHGGGFILFSAALKPFHDSCERMAREVPAIVVSVEYRLAPEHPLPAAYDDASDAIRWVGDELTRHNPILESADPTRFFLMGSSAGANIAYHAALRAVDSQIGPIKISGLILDQAYFGGVQRTESEMRLTGDRILSLPANDLMWQLSLPEGADRNHEFCNPIIAGGAQKERVGQLPRCLVAGHGQDPLVDRQTALVRMLEECGVDVVARFSDDGFHGVELFDPSKALQLLMYIRDFISQLTVPSPL